MRTVIAGSRGITDIAAVEQAVRECGWWPSVVLSGKALGVDTLGEQWAASYGVPVEPYPANWRPNGVYDRNAGFKRNHEMAQKCDAVIAVWDGVSGGTKDMIDSARALGRRVHVHTVVAPQIPAWATEEILEHRNSPLVQQACPRLLAAPPAPPAAVPPPPRLEDLPAGYQLAAGLGGVATVVEDLDFETYSEAGYLWDEETGKWEPLPGAPNGKKGLEVVGAAAYAEHPSTEVMTLAYDLKDGRGRRRWHKGMPPPADLHTHVVAGKPLEAWNVGFEQWIWEKVCVERMGWPAVHPDQWRCAMAKARAHALPGKLGVVGEVLDLDHKKLDEGKALLKRLSVPRNPTKSDPRTRITLVFTQAQVDAAVLCRNFELDQDVVAGALKPKQAETALRKARESLQKDLTDTTALADYNEMDIVSEAEASSKIPDLTPMEFPIWRDDRAINHRGVRLDMDSVHNCIVVIEQAQRRYGEELQALAGCKPSEVAKLKGWLSAFGVFTDSLDEEAIDELLARKDLPPHCRRAIEIRATVGSASVKKVFAMRNQATRSGRLHDTYVYHGARTGRPTGQGVQSTNLPKAGPSNYRCGYRLVKGEEVRTEAGGCGRFHGAHTMWCHHCGTFNLRGPKDAREWNPGAMEDALKDISLRSLDWLQVVWGDAMLTIAGVLRGLFIAADGHDFVSSDFTAIEGVVIACLAGEQWRIDAYANDQPMYLLSAERMYGSPTVAEMQAYAKANGQHHPLRQKGKFGELGLGFGGWIGALRGLGVEGQDDELKDMIIKWRDASPAIVHLWGGQRGGAGAKSRWDVNYFGLEGCAVQAVLNPGTEFHVRRLDGQLTGISYIVQGEVLYCKVPTGGLITYHRPQLVPSADSWRGWSLSFEGWNTNPKSGPTGWLRMNTYSGKLAENVTQKVARDKQMGAIRRCEAHGAYPVVMHTYDEIVAEVREDVGSVIELEGLMTRPDPWNEGWPIKAAGGWRAKRYRKG